MAEWDRRFLTPRLDSAGPTERDSAEFDESDIWGGWGSGGGGGAGADPAESPSDPVRAPRRGRGKNKPERAGDRVTYPGSLPVSVPRRTREGTGGGDDGGRGWVVGDGGSPGGEFTGGGFIPPHELLRRCRAASFSVQEGLGRTLKGRDLSRVRNTVWAKIGFED